MNVPIKKSHRAVLITVLLVSLLLAGAYTAARIVLPQAVEEETTRLFGVPCSVRSSGINFFNASFWIRDFEIGNLRGFSDATFFSAKKIVFNLSFTSFLARELIFEDIRYEQPMLNMERSREGEWNWVEFQKMMQGRFWPRMKIGKTHFFNAYAINRFSIKDGILRVTDQSQLQQAQRVLKRVDFSFSDFAYPPEPGNFPTTSFYLTSKIQGYREGSILLLGRGNFFLGTQNFRIRSDLKNIPINEIKPLFSGLPLLMSDGYIDIRSEAVCRDHSLVITNEAVIQEMKLAVRPDGTSPANIFGSSTEKVIQIIGKKSSVPFRFDFTVSGDLNAPSFRLIDQIKESVSGAVIAELQRLFERLKKETFQPERQAPPSLAKSAITKPFDLTRQTVARLKGPAPTINDKQHEQKQQ